AGRLGQKTGGGWYDYRPGDRRPHPSPTVAEIIRARIGTKDSPPPALAPQAIQDRLLPPMVNEGFHILEEGIAHRPRDIDLVEIHGYGFPRWRGGLMAHADQVGLAGIRAALLSRADPLLIPSPLLDRLVQAGQTSADLDGR
ncbi:MAG: 3-hydroxyacyl-CoA dehydrogenase, partial [Rhodospirillum sp.]|nr:3-hydroxyacyl-CoA dehydrogenase [Rhodospirillum sp.]